MSGDALLRCEGIDVAYGANLVLVGVDVTVDHGEIVALLGTNGSGKSTLLRAISRLLPLQRGTVVVGGADLTRAGPQDAIRAGVVHVAGGRGIFPGLSVAEHFTAASFLCDDRRLLERRVHDALDQFPILRARWATRAGELSGGEQHVLAFALALLGDPSLLLVDEVSLGLAHDAVDRMLAVVRDVRSRGCGVLLVEQSIDIASHVADRAYFLDNGIVRSSGTPEHVRTAADRAVFIPSVDVARSHPASHPAATEASLSVRGVTKRFGGITAVDHASFDIEPQSIVGLIGPNGAGKTTLVDIIAGATAPDHGTLVLHGTDVTRLRPHRRAQLGLGRSFQDARLFPALTVAESIAVAFETRLDVRDHLASTLALPAARAMEDDVARHVDELIDLVHLDELRDIPVSELSTGTRRVVELAMTLAHRPRVVLLDEPTAGLAEAERAAMGPLLLRLRDETGCSMLVVEHDLGLVDEICDEVLTMEDGRLAGRRLADEVRTLP